MFNPKPQGRGGSNALALDKKKPAKNCLKIYPDYPAKSSINLFYFC